MKQNKRHSKRNFPPYKFIPGKFPHPEKEGGYHFGKELIFKAIGPNLFENEDFLYALDLYNYGYFWEAHVFLEGLWHQVRKGDDPKAALFKGMIKLCAAGVKREQGMEKAALGHEKRAQELLGEFKEAESKIFSEVMSLLVK